MEEPEFNSAAEQFTEKMPGWADDVTAVGVSAKANAEHANAAAEAASSSAGTANTRANDANQSATTASQKADAANNAASSANAANTALQKLYLGPKAAHPTTDNQGQPLQEGTWYTNSTTGFWYWWKDGAWKVGVGDLSSVDYTTQVVNKPQTLAAVGIADMTAARNELSAPSKTGGGASGTWPISISGNAATAGSATTANGASAAWSSAQVSSSVSGTEYSARIRNNGGMGDSAVAALAFETVGQYAAKLYLRPDGFFGYGGWNASSWRWYITPAADMVVAGNVTAYSDPALKDDVERISDALAIVEKLDGVRFTWNDKTTLIGRPGVRDIGVLADQVEDVLPELVSLSVPDAANDGKQWRTVAYDKLAPVLIEALKQLNSRVKQLESKQ